MIEYNVSAARVERGLRDGMEYRIMSKVPTFFSFEPIDTEAPSQFLLQSGAKDEDFFIQALQSKEDIERGEFLAYDDVFGHPQPGL